MVVSILGCGWYGKALALSLIKKGFSVKGSATSEEKVKLLEQEGIESYLLKLGDEDLPMPNDFFNCDILVISIPPRTRSGEGDSYLAKLHAAVKNVLANRVKKVIYISSTGVYSEQNKTLNELDEPLPDNPSGQILLDAENLLREQTEFQTTIIRFGGLVGPGRHPGRFFAGKTEVPNGRAPVNMIYQSDAVGITEAIINNELFGYTINACAPDHPAKGTFYPLMASLAGYPKPQFIDELQNWKLVESVCLEPLLKYKFQVPEWKLYPADTI